MKVSEWSRQWLNRLRQTRLRSQSGFENTRYLGKWLFLGITIGTVAGLGAIVFYAAIEWSTRFFLGSLVGYLPPSPVGEGYPTVMPMERPWLLPLVTAVGGLLSGLIVFSLAPEAEGHGTDAAIAAIHHHRAHIRTRIPPIKLLASAITIGSGGSGGREGPAAQISAGFGSLMGQWLNLSLPDRRIAVAAGMGAGIGAIFRAPLGGAVLAAEVLYVHDIEMEAIIPALIASIVGYSIYGAYYGFMPIFGNQPYLGFDAPIQLVYYALLGLLSGLVGILYARSFYGAARLFHRLPLPRWVKPALGGFLVGLIGLVLPQALHMGYGWVQIAMGPDLLTLPLWVILILPLAKILTTSLSISSGGSGGIFGPGMVIGGMLGASFWRLGHNILPMMPTNPAPLVIVGMMAMFGGIAHAPLAVMLMVAEMTGNVALLAPALVAVAISTAITGNNTIYQSQLLDRASSPAHRIRFSFPLLSSLLVRDVMVPVGPTVGNPTGGASTPDGGDAVLVQLPVQQLPTSDLLQLDPNEPLDAALEELARAGAKPAVVVEQGHVVGQLTMRDIVAGYRAALHQSVRRAKLLPPGTVLLEARLGRSSVLCGQTLREAKLPKGTLVVSIIRHGETLFPTASTRLEAGDIILVMTDPVSESSLRAFLEGQASTA